MGFLKSRFGITLIGLIVSWLVFGGLGYYFYTDFNSKALAKDEQIDKLNAELSSIGEMVPVYALVSDVKMGKQIQDTDVTEVKVPVGVAGNFVTDIVSLPESYYRTDMSTGTLLSKDDIYDEALTDDLRYYDVVVNNVPVGLKEGSYVDIRITLPMGEDFVGLSHKKVVAINAGVLKLSLTSKDIHTYNSMLIDSLLYTGTSIYGIEYVEGGAQKPADTYYPVSANILAVAQKDPNLLEAIKADMLQKREGVDKSLSQFVDESLDSTTSLERILAIGRERYSSLITEASREALRTEEAQKALEASEQISQ